jgi:hypothetical protein
MVLDRRMFRRPSQIAPNKGPSSKGVGITSGLTRPVKMETGGDVASKYKEYLEELSPITEEMYPKQSFFERAGMSPFQFFAALGTPMQPGQTVLGKIGEAGQYLDIKPESTAGRDLASKIALEKALEKDEEETYTLSPGENVYDSKGNLIVKGPEKEEETKTHNVKAGEFVYDSKGNLIVKGPDLPPETKDTRKNVDYFEETLQDSGLVQRKVSYFDTEQNKFITENVGEPFYKSATDKINDSVDDVDAYIDSLKNQTNPKTNAIWTETELATLRSEKLGEQLSKQKLFLSKDEELEIARGEAAIGNDAEIAKGIINNIIETAPQINQQLINVNTAQASVDEATTGAFVPMRNSFAMIMDSFPALKAVIPKRFQGNIAEALNTGDLSITEVLDSVLTQGVLDRAAGGSLKGNYNSKEIDLFIDSGAKVLQTKEGQSLLLDLQERQLEILANSNILLNEFTSNGTINGEPVKDSIAAAFKIKELESEAFQAYANSDEIQNRIQEALGYGDYRGSDFFLNAEPLVISGNKFDIKDLWEQGRVNVVGYADETGTITLPTGTVYSDPNLVTPKQPVYQIRISDQPDKNGLYDFIFISGDQFTRR